MRPHDKRKRDARRLAEKGIEGRKDGLLRTLRMEKTMDPLNYPPDVDVNIIGAYNANAGRDYTCDVCGKPIFKGERYTRAAFKEDGKFKCHHYHYTCN